MHIVAVMGLRTGVLGASGFTGGELVRLLAGHPVLEVDVVAAAASTGRTLSELHPHLRGSLDRELVDVDSALSERFDVCFSCLPRGALPQYIDSVDAGLLIDLADDFRDASGWTYALPELNRDSLTGATRVANPGCYPTAMLLALVPFARAGAIRDPIVVDALSGTSGAGRKSGDVLSLSVMSGDVRAYSDIPHRHVAEMERELARLGGLEAHVSFTPHLVPIARGLLVTARAGLTGELDDEGALSILSDAYLGESLIDVLPDWPSIKPVAGSPRAHVSARVDRDGGWLVASCAIDNLGKGAAAQAIQNANVVSRIDETAGLTGVGVWP
jgi:N-acetyl-gamma-glutamyl-phosphate reductase